MDRYIIYAGVGTIHPDKWDKGEWVLFEDAQAEIERLGARIRDLEACIADLLKSQARFVPCSERLPTERGAYVTAVVAQAGHLFLKVMLFDRGWVSADPVVSWLDNLPPLDGSVRIKGGE